MTISLQKVLPQHVLSRFAGTLAESRLAWLKNWLINDFITRYKIDLSEAAVEKPEDYTSFNDFFTRKLKPSARLICPGINDIASPVDGVIAQIGEINEAKLLQAKHFYFDLTSLLGDEELARQFYHGSFATLYLAPHNYHRVHMPIDGTLIKTIYVPGKLFSVNKMTSALIPNLYSRNERLICVFETATGFFAMVLVGALIVGSIQMVWMDVPIRDKNIRKEIIKKNIHFNKGAELGYFKLGSTVILLFPKNKIIWKPELKTETSIQFGQALGQT